MNIAKKKIYNHMNIAGNGRHAGRVTSTVTSWINIKIIVTWILQKKKKKKKNYNHMNIEKNK